MQSNVSIHSQIQAEQQKQLWEIEQRRLAERPHPRVEAEIKARQEAALENYFFAQKFNKPVHHLKEFANELQHRGGKREEGEGDPEGLGRSAKDRWMVPTCRRQRTK